MKRVLAYITGSEWAMFCAVVTAALAEAPALAELVQGELNSGQWSYSGLVILIAGFVVRSKVWSKRSINDYEDIINAQAETNRERKAQLLAAEAVLEAARQGQPLPVKGYPVGGQQPHEGL